MKWLGRFLGFALAFFVGMSAAWVGSLFTARLDVPDLTEPVFRSDEETVSSIAPTGIVVTYAGVGADGDHEPYLRFIIHNGIYRPITYGAHSSENPFPRLKINGNEVAQLGRCGTGIQTFYILPGRSAEVHVYRYEFLTAPQKGDRISAGFYLRPALGNEYSPHYSEPFSLPEDFRQSIEIRSWSE